MKFNLNVEVTDDELAEYAANVVVKVIGAAWQDIGGAFANPQAVAIVQNLFSSMAGMQPRQRPRPTGTVGAPFGVPHAHHAHYPPGPYGSGPAGPVGPSPFMPDAGASSPPQNVRSIRTDGSEGIERCFPSEATRYMEEGVGCCRCATYNGIQRVHCRHCGHASCHGAPPNVTPPPPETAPPKGA